MKLRIDFYFVYAAPEAAVSRIVLPSLFARDLVATKIL